MLHRLATILLLGAFISITVLGFFSMVHAAGEHGGCIAALSKNAMCPVEADPFAEVAFHVGAFQSFSEAVLAPGLLPLLAFLVLAALFVIAAPHALAGPLLQSFLVATREHPRPALSLVFDLRAWTARHETSPTFS